MTLRIQSSTEGDALVFVLSGRIRENQVVDLETLFGSASGRVLVVDLAGIRLVDRAVVRFLARQEMAGTELRNCPAYIREWIFREKVGDN